MENNTTPLESKNNIRKIFFVIILFSLIFIFSFAALTRAGYLNNYFGINFLSKNINIATSSPVLKCGKCPMYTPPAPGWCADGVVINPKKDECGCYGHLICNKK